MKKYIFIITILLFNTACQSAEQKQKEPIQVEIKQDSLQIVAKYFLTFNEFINSYVVSDRDIDEMYKNNKGWVLKFFPTILKQYDMTLYSQFTIAIYLYLEQERGYLKDLWKKYKKFSGNSAKGISPNEEFKPILNLISEFKIEIMALD